VAATAFEIVHQDQVLGKLTFFDRMIFKGHLTGLYPSGAMKAFLDRQGVLLKDFSAYVKGATDELKAHVQQAAAAAGAPYRYLGETHTKSRGLSKEDLARQIAEDNGVVEGLVCVFSAVEPCSSFDIAGNRGTGRLEVARRRRKCLHFYLYHLHPELGLCHVRLQSWFPFEVQVWVNGREWLARQLDRAGVGYVRHANTFLKIDDWARAQKVANRLARQAWPRLLDRLVRPLNPVLADIRRKGFGGYYRVADQVEVATDVAFTTRPALAGILPDLFSHATSNFSSEDVLRFLGRPQGWRVKHRMERNSIKMYDKVSVLRVETTINNPAQFRVLRVKDGRHQWCPMRKGVANLPRFFGVGQGANERYLDALGSASDTRAGTTALHRLCRPRTNRGRRHSRFNPVDNNDLALFRAALAGEHTINGFRNKDITNRLYPTSAASRAEAKRRCARTSRQIAKLRGHGLVAKIPNRRLYRVTSYGQRVMSAALTVHDTFPAAYAAAT
jgi:hypothetical protein